MTIGEAVALIGLFISIMGIFIRYGIVIPMKNIMQPLELSINDLREEISDNKKFQKDTQSVLQNHDVRISLQEQNSKNLDRRIEDIRKSA